MDKPCFELKGSLFTLTVLQLFDDDMSILEARLKERVAMAPGFFNHTPVVIDLYELAEEKQVFDFAALKELLLSLSIIPVGVKGAAESIHMRLKAAGLAILAEAKKPKKDTTAVQQPETAPEQNQEPKEEIKSKHAGAVETGTESPDIETVEPVVTKIKATTMLIKQTIRSGRQVYAPDGDLIIIGSVSAGAEILADGNIHVYGTLRGRALAGVQGNQSASIFCHSLQAELISIAGIYLLSEDVPENKIGKITQTSLEQERLQIEVIA